MDMTTSTPAPTANRKRRQHKPSPTRSQPATAQPVTAGYDASEEWLEYESELAAEFSRSARG
jgi:hypothetical protein